MKEWFTAAELAELRLPACPTTESGMVRLAKKEGWGRPEWERTEANPKGVWRPRAARGGGVEYHLVLLPSSARATLMARLKQQAATAAETQAAQRVTAERKAAWARYEAAPDVRKDRARKKLQALAAVRDLVLGGMAKNAAVVMIGQEMGFSPASYYGWEGKVAGVDRADWLPYLVDHYAGRQASAEVSPEAWDMFLADYLRDSQPGLAECYNRLKDAARKHGWTIPSSRTLLRKLEREVPQRVIVLRREGQDAHDRLFPAQRRDRTVFHAMQALNYDGHKLDVFVKWPDGTVDRAVLLTFQDLSSNKIVGWRVDRSESAEGFRLAFGDVVEHHGIPDIVFSDNTMAAAAKSNTGGTRFRHRFKYKEEDYLGLFPALGVELRFTTPGHGQSKPIERTFGELSRYISRALECQGAFTGNKPDAKPESYGSKAVALETLLRVCEREINRYNSRADRNSSVAQGRSFDDVFAESYAAHGHLIRRLGRDDPARLLWLLAVEGVRCGREAGHIELYKNRYWAECLVPLRGTKVAVRFDPDNLHQPVHVYRLDGSYVGAADCIQDVGFADRDKARVWARAKSDFRRATRTMEKSMEIMDAAEAAALLPDVERAPAPETKVVRPRVFGNLAVAPVAAPTPQQVEEIDVLAAIGRGLRLVKNDQD